jgi:AcrR family transcriptional regulator
VIEVAKKTKGEQTRARILHSALRLFREHGYHETTMRLIADEAEVALGNTYYYFRSKEDLIHAFYVQLQMDQFAASEGVLLSERSFRARLSGVLRAQMAVMAPHQMLFAALFGIAADPRNPLNPFSGETRAIREACIQQFADIISGADETVPADTQTELPQLLWLYNLALVLFWIYDRSPGFVATYRLIELSSELIATLLTLTSTPLMAPFRRSILRMIESVREVSSIGSA